MPLFDSFVNKAKDKLGDIQNPKEKINTKKFKDPNAQIEQPVNPPVQQSKKKDKKNKPKREKYFDPVTGEEYYEDEFYDDDRGYNNRFYDDPINLYPSQKPESFHFFILENQYQDLERAIRGVKDVWDKRKNQWVIKRKSEHCFTDEESEEIVRTAQSHLSSDIKLAIFNRNEYPILLDGIYQQLWIMFKEIMDYRFGRFGDQTRQMKMKQQAVNIFNMLMMRIKANYSRAVEGRENNATHESVKGQESLQQPDRKRDERFYNSYT